MDIALQAVFIPGAWVERSFTHQGDLVALTFPSPRRLVLVLAWIMNGLSLKKVLLNKSPFRGGGRHFPDMFPGPRHSKTIFIPANTRERRTALSLNGTSANRRPRIECIKKELSPEEKRLLYCTVNVNQ